MDVERIKAIIELAKRSGACEIAVGTEEGSVRVRRRPQLPTPRPVEPVQEEAAQAERLAAPESAAEQHIVRATNVGWFHRGGGPGAEPFVELGEHVEPQQPLATIETLKMSNEVTTEVAGEVKEILVEEGVEVEFGQPLFVIQPDTE